MMTTMIATRRLSMMMNRFVPLLFHKEAENNYAPLAESNFVHHHKTTTMMMTTTTTMKRVATTMMMTTTTTMKR